MDDNLNFPVIKQPLPKHRPLSMDDYLEFVSFNLRYTVNIEEVRKQKKAFSAYVPFVLK